MNILFIISSLKNKGGTERVASLLANHLSCFYQITILSREIHSKENAYYLDKRVNDIKFTGGGLDFLMQCKQHVAKSNPDIVVIHTMSKLTPILLLGGIKAKSVWSIEHVSFRFHSTFFRLLRRYFYKKIDRVITLTKEDAINYELFHPAITIIANPTPLPLKIDNVKNTSIALKNIVSIGRLTNQKGFDLLIEAWSLVENQYPDWSLYIYGEGEDRDKLEKMITGKSLNNIILKGITSNIQAVYDNAAFYVMSSRFEGFGMVLIEAQSRGLPIVSFNCQSGPAEIITNNIDGYLVESKDVEALAERIRHLIENEFERESFSNNALLSAKRFESEVIIKQWVNLIESEHKNNG